jgi:oxygen-independent coproporphyrinogen-3 oxidase
MTSLTVPDVGSIQDALGDLPRFLEGPPHVYTLCGPRYEAAPKHERGVPRRRKLRLYVHVPFCRYKCSFCSYAVLAAPGGPDHDAMRRYLDAVRRELASIAPRTHLSGLFIGGGTPTALPPELLDELLQTVFAYLETGGDGVHTCESSPDTVTAAHAEAMRRHGIDRVSIGVQSLQERVLDAIARRHSARQALEAIRMLVGMGLVVNVDLIYGLPGQREDDFRRDVLRAAELGVHGLTLYALRLSERSAIGGTLARDERMDLAHLVRWRGVAHAAAAEAGFVQTRWHSFERAAGASATHRRLPSFGEGNNVFQLGVGNSARSHLGARIYRNARSPQAYARRVAAGESPVDQVFELDQEDRRTLYLVRAIGDRAIDRVDYRRAFGRSFDADYGERVERLSAADLVAEAGRSIVLTEAGKLVDDRIALAFYPKRALDALHAEGARIEAQTHAPAATEA